MKRRCTQFARLAWSFATAALLQACIDVPDFADPSLIDGPRVLAIVAEPPEVNPGQDVQLSLLVAGASDYDVSWRACGAFDTSVGGSQYGDEQPDEACGGSLAVELGRGKTATFPGAVSARLFQDLELAAVILGAALPEDTVEHIKTSVGLPFMVEASVEADGKTIRAVKRVLISERAAPHTNPPPPHFLLGAVEVVADADVPFGCGTPAGAVPELPPGSEIELAPVVAGDTESWLEPYQVLDLRGELRDREETAFYSWFSSGGELEQGVTKSPLRNEIWRTPKRPGCHPLWLVIRDGRGGTSACSVRVSVGAARCE